MSALNFCDLRTVHSLARFPYYYTYADMDIFSDFCTSTILFDAQLSVQYKVYRDARDSENVYHEFKEDAAIEDSRKIALNYLPAYT